MTTKSPASPSRARQRRQRRRLGGSRHVSVPSETCALCPLTQFSGICLAFRPFRTHRNSSISGAETLPETKPESAPKALVLPVLRSSRSDSRPKRLRESAHLPCRQGSVATASEQAKRGSQGASLDVSGDPKRDPFWTKGVEKNTGQTGEVLRCSAERIISNRVKSKQANPVIARRSGIYQCSGRI